MDEGQCLAITKLAGKELDGGHTVTRKYRDSTGRARVAGRPDLKGTQAYPKGFGDKLAELFDTHRQLPAS